MYLRKSLMLLENYWEEEKKATVQIYHKVFLNCYMFSLRLFAVYILFLVSSPECLILILLGVWLFP